MSLPSRGRFSFDRSQNLMALIINIPTLLIVFLTLFFPIVYSLFISLYDWNLKRPHKVRFVGLGNYGELLASPDFLLTVGRTILFVFLTVLLVIIFAIAIASLLTKDFRGRGFLRTVVLIPWAIPPVVNGIMWKWHLDSSYGTVNLFLKQLGIIEKYRSFLTDPGEAFFWVIMANVWKQMPFAIIILLAALQTIPKQLYEAARIDGASRSRQFWSITAPYISSSLMVVLIFLTMISLRVFDLIYVLTSGGPGDATSMIGWDLYNRSFRLLDVGTGNAVGYIIAIITFSAAVGYYRLFRKNDMVG